MSLEQVPTVTTLLRASRDANEYLLKEVFRDILENGISKENLNSTDRSGRTAISYICSTNLTNFLELFLQLPGIDVNKPDNEGNTPLHFAAQAGLSDVVNMLITKCRSLIIDPKNNLGFTPLMKAALQGRTRCAKLLLFAGASPVETDAGRGFRAEQWARFCGRHTCAETIEQCARARLLDKSTPCGRWSHDINLPVDKNALKARSCSITPQPTQNGFRSKFRKVFPFNFNSSKEKPASKEGEENYTKDLVNYLKSATLCVSGPALSANRKIIQSLIRPLEVPKLEVTYANNNALIKKYEAAVENGATDTGRRDSVEGTTDSRNGTPAHSPVPARAKVRN
ncbi:AGAP006757-PA-like protein [Anopheles sinensis]|uniref:AGAP006757-PA-like protein n=1 Tax=Anopheles sinensis TaxID=74873 RepID=A0A084WLC2_ANOSI|nr:AGAP006757-PA-like protein [Anopheles sinensis]